MIFPGGFLERSDFVEGQLLLNGQVVGLVSFSADNRISHLRRTVNMNLLPNTVNYSRPWASYLHRSNLDADIIRRIDDGVGRIVPSELNVVTRLQNQWAAGSPVTVELLNSFFIQNPDRFKLDKTKREFIRQYSSIPYSKCKLSKWMVPTKLKTMLFNPNTMQYQLGYWYHQNNFEVLKAELNRDLDQSRLGREREQASRLLKNYSERATSFFDFQTEAKDKSSMFYGIELEYEGRTNDNLRKTSELIKHAILKRDGSVHDGFEICTAPANFGIHKEKFKDFFSALPQLGLRAESNTGMHVHMSKKACSFLQLGKIYALVNKTDNNEFMQLVAGRETNSYCRPDLTRTNKISYPFQVQQGDNRYSRLNLGPAHTFELRMFSTPMTYKDFMKKMEFCKSLFDFTNTSEVSIKDADDLSTFLNYVRYNKAEYPHFMQFIKETI